MSRTKGTIGRETVTAAVASLGLPVNDVVSIAIGAGRVEAVVFDRDDQGERYLIPSSAGRYDDAVMAKSLITMVVE